MTKARLLLTPGEPAGIGPDITLMSLDRLSDAGIVAVCDPGLMANRAEKLGLTLDIHNYADSGQFKENCLNVLPVSLTGSHLPGVLDPDNARYVLNTLAIATDACLEGQFLGLVTGPVHKGNINDGGVPFSGHTEWLAQRAGIDRVVMMLTTDNLRVALATTHLPLRDVSDAITSDLLTETLEILHESLKHWFDIKQPHILVCGLNPHAGEGGHLGKEEVDIIIPVLDRMRKKRGFQLSGPLPADTLFTHKYLDDADAVLAMFHDQGLPVLKYQGFGNAVNITLGLPMIRTSVDHGTALDIAGIGSANPGSLAAAINAAELMAAQGHKINVSR